MWLWIFVGVCALSLLIEAFSFSLTSIWFAVGSLCAIIVNLCGANLLTQILVFVFVSLACIVFLRKFAVKWLLHKTEPTNTDALVGRETRLLTPITEDEMGTVKINDVVWSVTTTDETFIEQDERVKIVEIKGNKLIVEKIK